MNGDTKKDPRRKKAGLIFILISALLISIIIIPNYYKILSIITDSLGVKNDIRFIWVFAWCLFGLGLAAISASRNTEPENKIKFYIIYISYILIVLFILSPTIYIFFIGLSGYLRIFYYISSAAVGFLLGYKIDDASKFINNLFNSWTK